MKKLVSTNEAAKLLDLSLQGIHYRIKKNQLESVKKDGKTFVYIQTKDLPTQAKEQEHNLELLQQQTQDSQKLIEAKDQQIELLKQTIKFIKKTKDKEIKRIEKNQQKIVEVFKSEVDLLKSAFNEMKNIYALEHQPTQSSKEIEKTQTPPQSDTKSDENLQIKFMDIKDFFHFMRQHNKNDQEIKSILLDRIKNGDKRFMYNKLTKDVIIYKSDFIDLI